MADYQLPEGCALMLRVCDADGRSYGDFQWPGVGVEAVAPDWSPEPECGGGLHGWLYGQGDHGANEHGDEYRAALVLIDAHARLWTPAAQEVA